MVVALTANGNGHYNIYTAGSGQDGINMFVNRYNAAQNGGTETPYGLVITDLRMKGVDGADVTKRIKGLSPDTRVYVTTTIDPDQENDKIANKLNQLSPELKPDGVLQKPVPPNELIRLAEEARRQINYPQAPPGYNPPV